MKLFIVKRGEEWWEGAILIAAQTSSDAEKFYAEEAIGRTDRMGTVTDTGREITGDAGIIYNDDLR